MYSSPICSIRYLPILERVQTNFYKKLLNLPSCTPNYAVRFETNTSPLSVDVFKLTLNWAENIFNMSEDRYPKLCFNKIKNLANQKHAKKYNWFSLIRETFFTPLKEENLWDSLTLPLLLENKSKLITS